jgi:acetyl esterase
LQLSEAFLAGLPPVSIINARLDPLCSDGAKIKDALDTAGVPVDAVSTKAWPMSF